MIHWVSHISNLSSKWDGKHTRHKDAAKTPNLWAIPSVSVIAYMGTAYQSKDDSFEKR